MKSFLPICIDVSYGKIVIIGGGKVALQKLKTILKYSNNVFLYAKEIIPDILILPVICTKEEYNLNQITDALLVYACTNDPKLNLRICEDARRNGSLVNIADDSENSDFISPAIFFHKGMSIAVSSNGLYVKKSIKWRNAIKEFILNDFNGR